MAMLTTIAKLQPRRPSNPTGKKRSDGSPAQPGKRPSAFLMIYSFRDASYWYRVTGDILACEPPDALGKIILRGISICGRVSYGGDFLCHLDYLFSLGVGPLRTSRSLNVKLRLGETSRRSVELSAISSKLEEMALQLDRLRKLNGGIELLGHRNCSLDQKHDPRTHKFIGDSRDTIQTPRSGERISEILINAAADTPTAEATAPACSDAGCRRSGAGQ
jgi:hypothetical protein